MQNTVFFVSMLLTCVGVNIGINNLTLMMDMRNILLPALISLVAISILFTVFSWIFEAIGRRDLVRGMSIISSCVGIAILLSVITKCLNFMPMGWL